MTCESDNNDNISITLGNYNHFTTIICNGTFSGANLNINSSEKGDSEFKEAESEPEASPNSQQFLGFNISGPEQGNGLRVLNDLANKYWKGPGGVATPYTENFAPVNNNILNSSTYNPNYIRLCFQGKDGGNLFTDDDDNFKNADMPPENSNTLTLTPSSSEGTYNTNSELSLLSLVKLILRIHDIWPNARIILDAHSYTQWHTDKGNTNFSAIGDVATLVKKLWANIIIGLENEATNLGKVSEYQYLINNLIDFECQNEPYDIQDINTYNDTINWIRGRGSINGYNYNNPKIYLGVNAGSPGSQFAPNSDPTGAGQQLFATTYASTIDKYAMVVHQYLDQGSQGISTNVDLDLVSLLPTNIQNYMNGCPMNVITTEIGCAGITPIWTNAWDTYYNALKNYLPGISNVSEFLGSCIWVTDQQAANNNVQADPSSQAGQELNNISKNQISKVYTQFPQN